MNNLITCFELQTLLLGDVTWQAHWEIPGSVIEVPDRRYASTHQVEVVSPFLALWHLVRYSGPLAGFFGGKIYFVQK